MDNLDVALRMILACEAEATFYSISQDLALPTLKVVLAAICGELGENDISSQLGKIIDDSEIKDEQLDDFTSFYRAVVDKAITYLELANR